MPFEVFGHSFPTTVVQTVDLTAAEASLAKKLKLQIHGLNSQNKASIRINHSKWIDLKNPMTPADEVQIEPQDLAFGGIGGGFSTIRLTVALASQLLHEGGNTIEYRINQASGDSIGYRIIKLNLVETRGYNLMPSSRFAMVNPDTWLPELGASDQLAGKNLWSLAPIRKTPNGQFLRAHCADCHMQTGADLKYFAYSDQSIIERSRYHGLSPNQGRQIASYIRSLPGKAWGRPWGPVYQPGPGLDQKPAAAWAAGAGIDAVLTQDVQLSNYLLSNIQTRGTLNLRQTPIPIQLLDWNHWLPKIHPLDAWGSRFENSPLYTALKETRAAVRAALADPSATSDPLEAVLILHRAKAKTFYDTGEKGTLSAFREFRPTTDTTSDVEMLAKYGVKPGETEPEKKAKDQEWIAAWLEQGWGAKKYSVSQWTVVKTFEVMKAFELEEGYAKRHFGPAAEKRAWPGGVLFQSSLLMSHLPEDVPGILGPDEPGSRNIPSARLLDLQWYYHQIIVNAGNRDISRADWSDSMDWGYTFGYITQIYDGMPADVKFPLGFLQLAMVIKGMQNSDYGVRTHFKDFRPGWSSDLAAVTPGVRSGFRAWGNTPPGLVRRAISSLALAWIDRLMVLDPKGDELRAIQSVPVGSKPKCYIWHGRLLDRFYDNWFDLKDLGADSEALAKLKSYYLKAWSWLDFDRETCEN